MKGLAQCNIYKMAFEHFQNDATLPALPKYEYLEVEAETLSESWGKTSFKNWLKEVFRNKFQILWLVSELISAVGETAITARKISRIYPVFQKVSLIWLPWSSISLNVYKNVKKIAKLCRISPDGQ